MLKKFKEYSVNEETASDANNLTGILDTEIDWYGEDSDDKSKTYEDFTKPVYSVRASFVNLLTYFKKHNITNVKEIIARWSLGKKSANLDDKENEKLNEYLTALKSFTGINATDNIDINSGNFVMRKDNFLTLFKLVQGIIRVETGEIDKDDLGEYKSIPEIVVAGFELETKDENSKPAYKKYNVDLENEEYKAAKEEFLKGNKAEKTEDKAEEKKEDEKPKNAEDKKTAKADAFKKILKDFK